MLIFILVFVNVIRFAHARTAHAPGGGLSGPFFKAVFGLFLSANFCFISDQYHAMFNSTIDVMYSRSVSLSGLVFLCKVNQVDCFYAYLFLIFLFL